MLDVVGHVGDTHVVPPRPSSYNPAYLLDDGLDGTESGASAAARRRPPLKLDARGLPSTWLHVQSHHVRRMKTIRDLKRSGGKGKGYLRSDSGASYFEAPPQPEPMLLLAPASASHGPAAGEQQQQGNSPRQVTRQVSGLGGFRNMESGPGTRNGSTSPTRTGALQQHLFSQPQNTGFPVRKILRGRPSSAARITRTPSPFVDPFADLEPPTGPVKQSSRPHSAAARHTPLNVSQTFALESGPGTGPDATSTSTSMSAAVMTPTTLTPAPTLAELGVSSLPISSGEVAQLLHEGQSQSLDSYPVVPNGSLAGRSAAGGESEASRSLASVPAVQRPRSAKKVTFDVASAESDRPEQVEENSEQHLNEQVASVEQPATQNAGEETAAEEVALLERLAAMGETAEPEVPSQLPQVPQNAEPQVSENEPNSSPTGATEGVEAVEAEIELPVAATRTLQPEPSREVDEEAEERESYAAAVESMRSTPSIATTTASLRSTPSLRGNSRVNSQFMPYYYAKGKNNGLSRRPSSGMSAPVRVGGYGNGEVEQGYIVDRSLRVRARIIRDRFERLYRVLDSRPPAFLDFIYKQAGVDRGVKASLERPYTSPSPGARSRAPLASLLDRRASTVLWTPRDAEDSFRSRSAAYGAPPPAYGDGYTTATTSSAFPASSSIATGPAFDLLGPTPTAGPKRVASASGTRFQWNSHLYLSNFKDVVPVVPPPPEPSRFAVAPAQTRSAPQSRASGRPANELEFVHFCAPLDGPDGDMNSF